MLLHQHVHAQEKSVGSAQATIDFKNYPLVRLVFNDGTSQCGYYDSLNNMLYDCAGNAAINKPMAVKRILPSICCTDTDGDGVNDEEDKCVQEKGLIDNFGCPYAGISDPIIPPDSLIIWEKRSKDTDGDGIKDDVDKCVQEPGPLSNFGCPEIDLGLEKKVIKYIFFATATYNLSPASVKLLKEVIKKMNDDPKLSVDINGHTDNVGNYDLNRKLSINRTGVVKSYLLEAGIDKNRITYGSFGPDRPIDTNKTKAGRAKNNRVEILLIME